MPTVHVKLTIAGHEIEGAVPVPDGEAPPRSVLPVLRRLTDTIVALAERAEAEAGRVVSCAAGCGACCRQMVPVAPSEAHALAALVAAMPAGRRKRVENRFAAALAALTKRGLTGDLRNRHALPAEALARLDRAYFAAGIACPFLENESCSVHADRPLACREYLVTSAPSCCAVPTSGSVSQVPMPAKVSTSLARSEGSASTPHPWVPLVLSLEYAATSPEGPPQDPASLLRRIMTTM